MPVEKLGEPAERRPRGSGSPLGNFENLNLIWCPRMQSEASEIQKATRLL